VIPPGSFAQRKTVLPDFWKYQTEFGQIGKSPKLKNP
jgi:hypothetical protein